ncbi:MAG: family 16 glycoside hydrolase, partial [Verrucomicrobiota bacterium]
LQFEFSEADAGKTPKGFASVVSGAGAPGEWKIVMDDVTPRLASLAPNASATQRRPVLAQLSRNTTGEHYPILVSEQAFGDFTFMTRLKTVSGTVEQMAGVVFRYQDEKNYYYVRIDSIANTLRFYKVVGGQRSPAIGVPVSASKGVWHELSIECKANQIRILYNGQEPIPMLTDNSFATGKVGFWTKSDAVSHFTDARIQYTPLISLANTMVKDVMERYPRLLGLKIFAQRNKQAPLLTIASTEDAEVNQPAPKVAADVLETESIFHLRERKKTFVTMPMKDRNGEVIAAIQVILDPFPGQTEQNAIARALPIVKMVQGRVTDVKQLFE